MSANVLAPMCSNESMFGMQFNEAIYLHAILHRWSKLWQSHSDAQDAFCSEKSFSVPVIERLQVSTWFAKC